MALAIQHKRSQTTGDTPTASDIAQGEIALNLADLRLFTKDHNNAIQRIGGEDVAATLDFTKADGTVGGISVTGFKMNFKKADGTLTTYNIFQQMMLFSLFHLLVNKKFPFSMRPVHFLIVLVFVIRAF